MSENTDKTWTEQKQHVLDPPADKWHKTELQVRKMIMYCASACWLLRFKKKYSLKVGIYLHWSKKQSTAYRQMLGDGPLLSELIHCVQQHGKNQHEFLPSIPAFLASRDAPQEKHLKTYWTYGRRGVTKWGCEWVSKSRVKVLIFLALK